MSFRLFGISVEITVPFCLLLAFMLLVDRTGMMSHMLLAVCLHEGGHLLAMARCAALPKALRLRAGTVAIEKSGRLLRPGQEACIAAAGPAANLVLAAVGLLWYGCTGLYAAAVTALTNLLFAAYNLLPILGLDGGDLCLLALSGRMGERRAARLMGLMSWGLIIGLLAAGTYLLAQGAPNPTLLTTGVYLAFMQALKGRRPQALGRGADGK